MRFYERDPLHTEVFIKFWEEACGEQERTCDYCDNVHFYVRHKNRNPIMRTTFHNTLCWVGKGEQLSLWTHIFRSFPEIIAFNEKNRGDGSWRHTFVTQPPCIEVWAYCPYYDGTHRSIRAWRWHYRVFKDADGVWDRATL